MKKPSAPTKAMPVRMQTMMATAGKGPVSGKASPAPASGGRPFKKGGKTGC